MPAIDSLSIQISASSEKAVHAIDRIITSLNSLNATLTATATATGLTTLTNSLTTISKITIPAANFEGITKLSSALAKLGSTQTATTVLPQIGNAFNEMLTSISAAPVVNENVTQMASALAKLGGTNAQRAITTIPQLSTAFRTMIVELSNAPTISRNIIELANSIAQLSRSGREATSSTAGLTGAFRNFNFNVGTIINPLRRLRLGFGSIAAIAGHVYANFFLLIRGARLLGKAIDYSSSMTEAANVVSVTFGKSADAVTDFTETCIKEFGLARLSATQFASRFQAMGKTMGITSEQVVKANDFITSKISGNTRAYEDLGDSVADVSINLTKLTADIASLYNQDYEDVAKDMQSIYTGMTRPLRKYGLDLTNATLKEWAMSQGLESNIEKMTQAEKTMLRYQYVMSRTAGAMGDFQKTADTWANSLRTVKQLLQEIARVIGEALINALKPALIAFRQFLTNFLDLTQKALNALGKLLGWRQIDYGGASLVEDMEDYGEAIDDAAGAAKKLKGQLRGIDELNNLTTNPKSGGGSSGLSGLASDIESIWDKIKDSDNPYLSDIESWREFGQKIADKIGEGLSSINWSEVYTKASNFGTNFAEFLNGLIKPKTWNLFGKTLGGGIMTAIESAFAFGSNFDWDNLGTAIAEGINGFFGEFEGGKLADTIDVFIQGFETTFKKAVEKINWKNIFADMLDFLMHIDLETVDIVIKTVGTIYGVFLISKAITQELAAMGAISVPAVLAITGAGFVGFKIGNWINEQLEETFGEDEVYEFWETVFDFWSGAGEKIKKPFEELAAWYKDNEYKSLIFTAIATWGGDLKRDVTTNIGPIWDEVKTEWEEFWENIFDDLGVDTLILKFEDWIDEIKGLFENDPKKFWSLILTSGVSDSLVEDFETIFGLLTMTIEDFVDDVKKAIESLFTDPLSFARNFFNQIGDWAEPFMNDTIDGLAKLFDAKNLLTGKTSSFSLTHIKFPKFATGGYPTTGSLFWAGEQGAELVGSINGNTAVASNGEITGITQAIRSSSDAEIALLRQQNELLVALVNKEFGISKNDLFNSVRSSANEYTRMTGRPAW